jgi:hypothetical protein
MNNVTNSAGGKGGLGGERVEIELHLMRKAARKATKMPSCASIEG